MAPDSSSKAARTTDRGAGAVGAQFGARVHRLRRSRRWSLETLARASGVSRSMLSEIERNEANPTIATAFGIARALGMRLGDLVDEDPHGDSLHDVIRADEPAFDYRTDAACRIRTLSPLGPDRTIELYRLEFEPGGELRSQPHHRGVRELVYVDRGRVRVESGPDQTVLAAGDSVTFAADVPHAIVNVGRSRARAFLIDMFPAG
jgi:transcriptional regulator with XRE-family HTH domain